jgi:hypothetical protein
VKKTTNLLKKLLRLDNLLDQQTPLFLLLVLVLILRLPNLFEPYWYGDEGIYLTLGQSLNKGAKLYSEIIDHKTPIIYYLARVQTQLNFRLLNIAWMLVTTTAFYYFAKRLLGSVKLTIFASLIFVLLTTLPWLEGNIPNGELFVLGFVLSGFLIVSKSQFFLNFLHSKPVIKTNVKMLFFAGFLVGLGILTKVPSILDLMALMSVGYFSWTNLFSKNNEKNNLQNFKRQIVQLFYIFLGVLTPILISIVYFVSIGSGQDYLDFGLLYNFRYAGSWGLPFNHPLLLFSFTLLGKIIFLLISVVLLTLLRKYLKPVVQFILMWFVADLFGSLLSNRPYPHYFIQLVPPLALLVALLSRYLKNLILAGKQKLNPQILVPFGISILFLLIFVATMKLLEFKPYQTQSYYANWWKLVTGHMSKQDYRQTFDTLMKDNYKAAPIIKSANSDNLFIWGTNPMLYALTETQPTGRFTVSFHIKDFDAFGETARDVVKKSPPFIVVMKNEKHDFKEFYNFLVYNYLPDNNQFEHFVLWKRINANNN